MWQETLKQRNVQLALVSVASLGIGGAVTWQVANKQLQAKYEADLEREIAEAKLYYKSMYQKLEKPATPGELLESTYAEGELVEAAVEAVVQYHTGVGTTETVAVREEFVQKNNLFEELGKEEDETYDLQFEISQRDTSKPYLISEEEWQERESGYDQITLSWYDGDGVLADEQDKIVDDVERLIGTTNLRRFGHGSGDPNTMFIRNENSKIDFEVVRSDGHYAHEVMGLNHSDEGQRRVGVRKFRLQEE